MFLLSVTSTYLAFFAIPAIGIPLTVWLLRRKQQATVSINLTPK